MSKMSYDLNLSTVYQDLRSRGYGRESAWAEAKSMMDSTNARIPFATGSTFYYPASYSGFPSYKTRTAVPPCYNTPDDKLRREAYGSGYSSSRNSGPDFGYNVREARPRGYSYTSSRSKHTDYEPRYEDDCYDNYPPGARLRSKGRSESHSHHPRVRVRRDSYTDHSAAYSTRAPSDPFSPNLSSSYTFSSTRSYSTRSAKPYNFSADYSSSSSDCSYSTRNAKPHIFSTEYSSSSYDNSSSGSSRGNSNSSGGSWGGGKRSDIPSRTGLKPPVDLYTVLTVSRTASADELKKAHRNLSMKYHPDRCSGLDKAQATDKMAEINRAYDVLKDEKRRAVYDQTGEIFECA